MIFTNIITAIVISMNTVITVFLIIQILGICFPLELNLKIFNIFFFKAPLELDLKIITFVYEEIIHMYMVLGNNAQHVVLKTFMFTKLLEHCNSQVIRFRLI